MVPPAASILATAAEALPPTQFRPSLGAGSPACPASETGAESEAWHGHFHHLSSSSGPASGLGAGTHPSLPCKQQQRKRRSDEAFRDLQQKRPAQQQMTCLV